MTRLFANVVKSSGLKGILAAAIVGVLPAMALADHHDQGEHRAYGHDREERRDRDDHRGGGRVEIDVRAGGYERPPVAVTREARVWVEPVYRTVCDRVWVEPVYRTVCDRVWVEPVVQKVCERVWVPD